MRSWLPPGIHSWPLGHLVRSYTTFLLIVLGSHIRGVFLQVTNTGEAAGGEQIMKLKVVYFRT